MIYIKYPIDYDSLDGLTVDLLEAIEIELGITVESKRSEALRRQMFWKIERFLRDYEEKEN